MIQPKKLSIIVLTYNWPEALNLILEALSHQTCDAFEVIVADDGSSETTKAVIQNWIQKANYPLLHSWHEDRGFRASAARNLATLKAQGDYVVYLDGDCIPQKNFVKQHRALAQPGYFVTGNRIFISQALTKNIIQRNDAVWEYPYRTWFKLFLQNHCNRSTPLLPIPLLNWMRQLNPTSLSGARSCNFGAWLKDLMHINGWDESFQGWGFEDTDLILRLNFSGVKRKSGRFSVPVIHLWHPIEDRTSTDHNHTQLNELKHNPRIHAKIGLKELQPVN